MNLPDYANSENNLKCNFAKKKTTIIASHFDFDFNHDSVFDFVCIECNISANLTRFSF